MLANMDSKEIKAALKSAREAIRTKDYKEALKHCKGVIKHDKHNYNALVFIGVAADGLEQGDQALAAYRKATEADPTLPLAWQGLASALEKTGEATAELVQAYQKLVEILENDKGKVTELKLKLVCVHMKMRQHEKALTLCEELLPIVEDAHKEQLWISFVPLLQRLQPNSDKLLEGYEILLSGSLDEESKLLHWKSYISQIRASKDFTKLEEKCREMVASFPREAFPRETLAHLYFDQLISGTDVTDKFEECCNVLKGGVKDDSIYVTLGDALDNLKCGSFGAAREAVTKALDARPNSVGALIVASQVNEKIRNRKAAEIYSTKGLDLLRATENGFFGDVTSAKKCLNSALVMALSNKESTVDKALALGKEILSQSADDKTLLMIARVYLKKHDSDNAKQVLSKVAVHTAEYLFVMGILCEETGDNSQAEQYFERADASEKGNGEYTFHLAKTIWNKPGRDNKEKAFQILLLSAKADPYLSDTFLYLGHYYNTVVEDNTKASRCYEKAYNLDSDNEEAGSCLVDCLNNIQQEEKALSILVRVTTTASAGSAKWAWLRLGMYQMKQGDNTSAIASLQSALRAHPSDNHCWECLGDAYMSRGSLTAAMKAYTKTVQLNPDSLYSLYQVACIKLRLGLHPEAVEEYRCILDKSHDYVPALIGLGEAHLELARSSLKMFFHGRSVDHCQSAIQSLTLAATHRPDLSCTWKMLGDACTILHVVTDPKVKVNSKLLSRTAADDTTAVLNKKELLALGARCYGMALKQCPDNASLWHDLGVNYFHQIQTTDSVLVSMVKGKAIQALQKAVSLDPSNHQHWTALGVVAANPDVGHLALAQHCFIKSIETEQNNVVAWTNLGTLYLENDEVELAHSAFKMAQSLEPEYVPCWVGQAMIAEIIGQEVEAMDLFRHTTELGNQVEGLLGYASWVCDILQDEDKMKTEWNKYVIEKMAAVPAASDALAKYTDRIKSNPVAYNLHGQLLELQKLYKGATNAYNHALELYQQRGLDKEAIKVRMNYARALSLKGDYELAIEEYQKLPEEELTYRDVCGLALAYQKADKPAQSIEAFEKAVSLASNNHEKSEIYTAIGMVSYKCADTDATKSALFTSTQMDGACTEGLLALCALALERKDADLAAAVIHELEKDAEKNSTLLPHVMFFTINLALMTGRRVDATRALMRAIHQDPANSELWRELSQLLMNGASMCDAAHRAAVKAKVLDTQVNNKTLLSYESVCGLGAGNHYGHRWDSLKATQRACHLYPDDMLNWCNMLSSLYANHVVRKLCKQDTSLQHPSLTLNTHIMAQVESVLSSGGDGVDTMQAVHLWSVKQYIVFLIAAERATQAAQFIKQALWLYENDTFLQCVLAVQEENFEKLKKHMEYAVDEHNQNITRRMLLSLYLIHGLTGKAENLLSTSAKSASGNVNAYIMLASLMFHLMTEGKDGYRDKAMDSVNMILTMDPCSYLAHLIKALLNSCGNNQRASKHSYKQTIATSCGLSTSYGPHLARKHLYNIYIAKDEKESIKLLLQEAEKAGDIAFVQLFSAIHK